MCHGVIAPLLDEYWHSGDNYVWCHVFTRQYHHGHKSSFPTHENTVVELHSANFDGLEELRDGLALRLWVNSRTRGRDLCGREVWDIWGWNVHVDLWC